jgi:hypothetical protein
MSTEKKSLLEKLFELQHCNLDITKSKEAYGYNYAPLDVIHKALLPELKKLRVGFYHRTDYDSVAKQNNLTTVIYNVDDTSQKLISTTNINDEVKLAKMNTFMVIGSAMTYFRRYHLVAMCGLLADSDDELSNGKPTTSVQNAKQKVAGPDFIKIFKNLIDKKKTSDQISKMLNNYKSQMTPEDFEAVNSMITEHFNK